MSNNKSLNSLSCSCAIGNSLDINMMIKELYRVFAYETSAINVSLYLLNNDINSYITFGKKIKIDINNILEENNNANIINSSFNENTNKVLMKFEKAILFFFYKKEQALEPVVSLLESLSEKINHSINACLYTNALESKNKILEENKKELDSKVLRLIKLNIEKEKQIQAQHKMVQMGELIGNIAHQWREPLCVISTAASGMKVQKELDMLNDNDFFHYVDNITNNVQILSKTIDEFRDYIQYSNKIKEVIIQDRVIMASLMVKQSFDFKQIEIIQDFIEKKPILYKIILGELLQVLISIFNNAKEAFEGQNIKNKWIKYAIFEQKDSILITIEDNANGINEDILENIFDLNFTTKSKKNGTGIGLYSGFNIVVNNLKGKLYAKNTEFGAKFFIEFPKN